jgi:hypothetical protein
MELSKEELITIFEALEVYGGAHELMDAVAIELEKLELEEMSFDDDDGCAGGACKL